MKIPYARNKYHLGAINQLIWHIRRLTKINHYLSRLNIVFDGKYFWQKGDDWSRYGMYSLHSSHMNVILSFTQESRLNPQIGYTVKISKYGYYRYMRLFENIPYLCDDLLLSLHDEIQKPLLKMLKNYPAVDIEELCAEAFKPDRIARRVADYDDYMEYFYN